ncbi:MAG: hypothetical protein IJ341_12815 [Bacteroidales bacterium]|nr:hypothetical protein [Bacteroidales bacterium]
MRRYFNVTEIKWGKYLHKCDWCEIRRESLPTDQNFLTVEDFDGDIYKAICEELTNTYGYSVDSIKFVEMTEKEAENQAIFLLLGYIC